MRIWTYCIFLLLISTFCSASTGITRTVETSFLEKLEIVQTPCVDRCGGSQHCDQLEGTEAITAPYIKLNAFEPVIFATGHGFKHGTDPVSVTRLKTRRDNGRVQPLYKLILFPFHGFW